MACSDNNKLIYNIKELPEAFSISSGDLLVVEDIEGTKTIDFDNIVIGLNNTTFGSTVTQNATDIVTLSSNITQNSAGILQNSTNIDALSTEMTRAAVPRRVVWLSPTAYDSGEAGIGTEEFPLDASTAPKLDAIYATYSDNVVFHYLPGRFETTGWTYNTLETLGNNMSHVGCGKGISTLALVGATGASSTTDGAILATNFNTEVVNVLIKDLTLDVNGAHTSNSTANGALIAVRVYGDNITVDGCEIIGFRTNTSDECFPVVVGRTRDELKTTQLGNNVIERCVFHSPAPSSSGPLTCVLMGTAGNGTRLGYFIRNDVVRNCTFYNMKAANTGFAVVHGVTAPIVQDCLFDGVDDCVYMEPQGNPAIDYDHLLVTGCVFRDHRFAVLVRQASPVTPLLSVIVENNHFYSRHGTHRAEAAIAMLTQLTAEGEAQALQRLIIRNNIALHLDGVVDTSEGAGTVFLWINPDQTPSVTKFCRNLMIIDNLIDYRNSQHLTINDIFNPAGSYTSSTINGNLMADGTNLDAFLSASTL